MTDTSQQPLTIVVAEDEAAIRMATVQYLERHGYRVYEASNGEELIALAKQHHVDIIFTDHEMPGVNGMDAIRIIRNDPQCRDVRIVLTSAYELHEDARKVGVRFLSKPYRLEEMLERLGLR